MYQWPISPRTFSRTCLGNTNTIFPPRVINFLVILSCHLLTLIRPTMARNIAARESPEGLRWTWEATYHTRRSGRITRFDVTWRHF
ncbi:hypothetical protein BD289DRAFT_1301 [Coniella lustricola]|uniref:Uncharacterized protein n=1 Tax=Coniella lustricola TaxID=2025994 RepID=A0A2T3ANG7_9PEZI|nr:hypothetical protein BD289DRAFT_1301 [Coniella lustricola]